MLEFQFYRHTTRGITRRLSVCHHEVTLVGTSASKADMRFKTGERLAIGRYVGVNFNTAIVTLSGRC